MSNEWIFRRGVHGLSKLYREIHRDEGLDKMFRRRAYSGRKGLLLKARRLSKKEEKKGIIYTKEETKLFNHYIGLLAYLNNDIDRFYKGREGKGKRVEELVV